MDVKKIITVSLGFAFLLISSAPSGVAQQGGPEDSLVQQFFPASLTSESTIDSVNGGPPPFEAFAYADADLNGTGTANYIVAAYSNGFSGAVLVLQKQGTSAVQVAAPSFPLMAGIYPSVTMLDVNNDGRPEAIVSFSSARGPSADWVLKWNGTTLQSIGPTSTDANGNVATLLTEALFIDLNGDGNFEIISPPQTGPVSNGQPVAPILNVYGLANGVYTQSSLTFNLFATFVRSTGQPTAAVRKFVVANPSSQYVMTIVNGDGNGQKLVSSAKILLNGTAVAGPSQFNQQVRTLKIPVTVDASNILNVTLASAPGSQLNIGIGPQ